MNLAKYESLTFLMLLTISTGSMMLPAAAQEKLIWQENCKDKLEMKKNIASFRVLFEQINAQGEDNNDLMHKHKAAIARVKNDMHIIVENIASQDSYHNKIQGNH